jgi:hypothetical protein
MGLQNLYKKATLTASATINLANSSESFVGRFRVQFVLTGGSFTLKPQAALAASGAAMGDIWYTNALTNATVPAGTTQTASGLIDVDAAGLDIDLVVTIAGGGSLAVYVYALVG